MKISERLEKKLLKEAIGFPVRKYIDNDNDEPTSFTSKKDNKDKQFMNDLYELLIEVKEFIGKKAAKVESGKMYEPDERLFNKVKQAIDKVRNLK